MSVGYLLMLTRGFVERRRLGEVIPGPIGVMLATYDAVQPDIVFVSKGRSAVLSRRAVEGVPDLIIEVTEPATGERDRGLKLRRYAATGVPHYWIVDALAKCVEEQVLDDDQYGEPVSYGAGAVFRPSLFPGLEIEIGRLWL